MKKILVLLFILLLPAYSEAAYKIILKNGASIDEVRTYSESGDEINLYFDTGSMSILKRDVLRIEGSESPSVEDEQQEAQPGQEPPSQQEAQSDQEKPALEEAEPAQDRQDGKQDSPKPADDGRQTRFNQLNNELNAINNELKTVQGREGDLVKEINDRSSRKFYNEYQLRQLEKEVNPLKQELAEVQRAKDQLFQKKLSIENQIRALQ